MCTPQPAWPPPATAPPAAPQCLLSLCTIFFDECLPLWAAAPPTLGGCGLKSAELGLIMATSGGALTLFQFVGYPRLTKRWPCSTLLSASAAGYAALALATPLVGRLARRPPHGHTLLLGVLMAHNALGKCLASACFTSVFLLINNSVTAAHRGRVNGLAMSLSSGFKAAGPTLGAVLFASSLAGRVPLGLGVWTAFMAVAAAMGVTSAASVRYLSRGYDSPPPEEPVETRTC
eukprot:389347-Prymnesium_polylepis.2